MGGIKHSLWNSFPFDGNGKPRTPEEQYVYEMTKPVFCKLCGEPVVPASQGKHESSSVDWEWERFYEAHKSCVAEFQQAQREQGNTE